MQTAVWAKAGPTGGKVVEKKRRRGRKEKKFGINFASKFFLYSSTVGVPEGVKTAKKGLSTPKLLSKEKKDQRDRRRLHLHYNILQRLLLYMYLHVRTHYLNKRYFVYRRNRLLRKKRVITSYFRLNLFAERAFICYCAWNILHKEPFKFKLRDFWKLHTLTRCGTCDTFWESECVERKSLAEPCGRKRNEECIYLLSLLTGIGAVLIRITTSGIIIYPLDIYKKKYS